MYRSTAIFTSLDNVDKKVRQDILHALLKVLDDQFAAPHQLVAAKKRLKCLVQRDSPSEEDTMIRHNSGEGHVSSTLHDSVGNSSSSSPVQVTCYLCKE